MLLCGVDEAGRGSVIGPLVIAGIIIKKSNIKNLDEIGVRDSKQLTRKKRNALFNEILDIAEFTCIYKIEPSAIDESVYDKNLNKLECKIMAAIINHLGADIAYVDSCDVNINRYTTLLRSHLPSYNTDMKLFVMHKADILNIVVSAASIIAKVIRDREIEVIQKDFKKIGSGYPSDKKTMEFIRTCIIEKNNCPNFIRKSWRPVKNMLEKKQKKIYDFI
jgi:ribonuclease HII